MWTISLSHLSYRMSGHEVDTITIESLCLDFKKYDFCWATHEDDRLDEEKRLAKELKSEGENRA